LKIAIPAFHTKISPRFDQTQAFVLLEIKDASVVAREELKTRGWSASRKIKELVDLGVQILICGAIDRASLEYLSFNGLNIYSWVTGEVDDAVACFLNNRMKPGMILGEKGKMKGYWQFCKGSNHVCQMFQTNPKKGKKGVENMPAKDGTGPRGAGPRSVSGRGGGKQNKGGGGGSGRNKGGCGKGSRGKGRQ
jgi:predicted Fe-Mo cluster-binding NifX family protein